MGPQFPMDMMKMMMSLEVWNGRPGESYYVWLNPRFVDSHKHAISLHYNTIAFSHTKLINGYKTSMQY